MVVVVAFVVFAVGEVEPDEPPCSGDTNLRASSRISLVPPYLLSTNLECCGDFRDDSRFGNRGLLSDNDFGGGGGDVTGEIDGGGQQKVDAIPLILLGSRGLLSPGSLRVGKGTMTCAAKDIVPSSDGWQQLC